MYASVVTSQVQPGKVNEYLSFWQQEVWPAVQQSGAKHGYVLANADTNETMAVVVYETEENARNLETSGKFRELAAKGAQMEWSGGVEPTRKVFEVKLEV